MVWKKWMMVGVDLFLYRARETFIVFMDSCGH